MVGWILERIEKKKKKKRVENRRENEWKKCLVERRREREKWWGLTVFSLGAPNSISLK